MFTRALHAAGLRGWHFHVSSMTSILVCIVLWIRAKTYDEEMRGNAERRALFVGLWPPTMWLVGDAIQREENAARPRGRGRRRRR